MACGFQRDQSFKRNMGIGKLGSNALSIKRKFRWTLQIVPYCGKAIGASFVKVAARPNYDIEETELNFLNAKTWIAGKLTWQSITVTYIDCGAEDTARLYAWIGKNAQLDDNEAFRQGTKFGDYASNAFLTMYDGCGTAMEDWQLFNCWPQAVNFGELDYSSSEEATIELTLRYDQVCYKSYCPPTEFVPCCSPCEIVPSDIG